MPTSTTTIWARTCAWRPSPRTCAELAEEYREKLLDAVSDFDDEIMEMYLEGEEIPADMIRAAIRKATIAVQMVPVICGTSYKNKGVQKLLDAIVDYHARSRSTSRPSRA